MLTGTHGKVRSSVLGAGGSIRCALLLLLSALTAQARSDTSDPDSIDRCILRLQQVLPNTAADYASAPIDEMVQAISAVDFASSELGAQRLVDAERILERIGRLSGAKDAVDGTLNRALGLRVEFASVPADERARAIHVYL